MTQMSTSIHLPLFPATLEQYFSVSHKGKTYELPPWQKLAIIVTAIAGIALHGIGVLFAFQLSYYLRNRLVEHLAADSIPVQPTPQPPAMVPPADEEQIKQRITNVRTEIDKMQKLKKMMPSSWEVINNKYLPECSIEGRHFVNIDTISYGYTIPNFSPLLLPKGIYCVHSSQSDDLQKTSVSKEYDQMMIEEFGEDNVYHLVLCFHAPSNNVKKVHKHQLELYDSRDFDDPLHKKNITAFEQSLN